MKKRIIACIAVLACAGFGLRAGFSEFVLDEKSLYEQIPLVTDTLTFIQRCYVHEVTAKELIYGALEGMLDTLDPYSEFLPPQKYEDIKTETKGEFGGLGLVVSERKGQLVVIAPMEGTPAHKAGMLAGDVILEIDGISTQEMNFSEAVENMRGKPGTEVKIVVRRGGEQIHELKLKRANIEIESVRDALVLTEGIGYVRVIDFGQKTKKMLEKALRDLESQKVQALILDLRNNPGGLLDAAVDVCHLFLKKGSLIVYTQGRGEGANLRFEAKRDRQFSFHPLVILVNEGSASGAEIVAGALKDNKQAIIVGKKTFGKASVQTVVPLRDKSAIRLTTAEYYTPSGVSIHGKGIEPDIDVDFANEKIDALKSEHGEESMESGLDMSNPEVKRTILLADTQVERAIDVIKGIAVWGTLEKE